MCGEKRVSQPFRRSISGSPPACAGRRRACVKTFFKGGDHPRVCGEKERRGKTRERTSGSPPRVRGEAVSADKLPLDHRITPACAGRSLPVNKDKWVMHHHPRVCGEKLRCG